MIPEISQTSQRITTKRGRAKLLKKLRATRQENHAKRAAEAKKPENIAKRNLISLRQASKVKSSVAGYSPDDKIRFFRAKINESPIDISVAVRFNGNTREIATEVSDQHFWQEYKESEFSQAAQDLIRAQFSKLALVQATSPGSIGVRLAQTSK